uniref:Uncharacterized protein n=1 Tax=Arundo donax TaxID=35708 RepID=A0A0A9EZG6_ARUDO
MGEPDGFYFIQVVAALRYRLLLIGMAQSML